MGWTVYEYYTALPMEFYAACEGYNEKQADYAKVIRFASFRMAESFAGSKAIGKIERFWPLPEDENKKQIEPMTKERYEAILKRHNIKKKNDG